MRLSRPNELFKKKNPHEKYEIDVPGIHIKHLLLQLTDITYIKIRWVLRTTLSGQWTGIKNLIVSQRRKCRESCAISNKERG